MEEILLDLNIRRVQSETVVRWIAMGIAATPRHLRLAKYQSVRDKIAQVVKRHSRTGIEPDACVLKNMEALFLLVHDLDERGLGFGAMQGEAA